jgi:hypothetical protein
MILDRMKISEKWLTLDDFNDFWVLPVDWSFPNEIELTRSISKQNEKGVSHSTFVQFSSQFEPFFDAAGKHPEVHLKLMSCLEDLGKFRIGDGIGKGVIKTIGRPVTHPAKKVRPKSSKGKKKIETINSIPKTSSKKILQSEYKPVECQPIQLAGRLGEKLFQTNERRNQGISADLASSQKVGNSADLKDFQIIGNSAELCSSHNPSKSGEIRKCSSLKPIEERKTFHSSKKGFQNTKEAKNLKPKKQNQTSIQSFFQSSVHPLKIEAKHTEEISLPSGEFFQTFEPDPNKRKNLFYLDEVPRLNEGLADLYIGEDITFCLQQLAKLIYPPQIDPLEEEIVELECEWIFSTPTISTKKE